MDANYNYIIATGWWCSDEVNDRDVRLGDEYIRDVEFHDLWYKAVSKFTAADKILVVDSNSPVKPAVKDNEIWIELVNNFGHSTSHSGSLSGVSRSFLMSLMYCYANDYDYWIYIEQDCLIYGEGIIEKIIAEDRNGIIFGSGNKTPQPVQHSLMAIKAEHIPTFIQRYTSIKARDTDISPEVKFAIATTAWLRFFPTFFIKWIESRKNIVTKVLRKLLWRVHNLVPGHQNLSMGYGRCRPIDFNDDFFYFQHGSKDEIDIYIDKTGLIK